MMIERQTELKLINNFFSDPCFVKTSAIKYYVCLLTIKRFANVFAPLQQGFVKKILDASIRRITHLESLLVFCWTGTNPVSVILLSTVRGSACKRKL